MNKAVILLKETARRIDPVIKSLLGLGVQKNTKALLFHQIEAGGKRLRPCLAIESCLACGGNTQDVLYLAAGLEILHTYSLIVDDLIDHSEKRRGKLTTWKKFGRSFAECAAVDYGAALLEAAARASNPEAVARAYGAALKKIVDGEILDILFEQRPRQGEPYARMRRFREVGLKDYLQMIGKKSAFLFQTSCELGARAARASQKEIDSLRRYGWHLGIAFQIIDDILDIYGKKEFGKPLGQDIRERKRGNILMLFTLQELAPKERNMVKEILRKNVVKESDVRAVIASIKKTGAKEKALKLAETYTARAKASLNALKTTPHRDILGKLAEFALQRAK